MKIKRVGDRPDTTQRVTMSFSQSTYEALRVQSEKLGYSIAGVARQVIDRGLAAGLLYADKPSQKGYKVVSATLMDQYCKLSEQLRLSDGKRIDGLIEHLDLKDQRIAQMQKGLELYSETIAELSKDLQYYQQERVKDVPTTVR